MLCITESWIGFAFIRSPHKFLDALYGLLMASLPFIEVCAYVTSGDDFLVALL